MKTLIALLGKISKRPAVKIGKSIADMNLVIINFFDDKPYFEAASVTWKITESPENPIIAEHNIKFKGKEMYSQRNTPEEISKNPDIAAFAPLVVAKSAIVAEKA